MTRSVSALLPRITGLLFVLVMLPLLVACSNDSNIRQPPRTPTSAISASATPDAPVSGLPQLSLQRVFSSLSFERMTGLYETPDSRQYLALEQRGRILIFDNRNDVTRAEVLVDLTDRVNSQGNEEGLLGLALAPDFTTSGVFYLDYTAQNPRRTVISRLRIVNGAVDKSEEQVILEIAQPFSNHNGGQIVFGPDDMLYIGMGDGGSGNDPNRNGQNLNVLLGKILRIDVSGAAAGLAYRVPADNPFAGRNDARGEIWAYGLRNPWRFSFDPQGGALWVGDVGQNSQEEVDVVTKGGNYGWNIMEADECLGGGSSCNRDGLILPVTHYDTGSDCSITGGFVYRGKAIAALQGVYLYSDYCSGKLWGLRYDGTRLTEQSQLADASFNVSSFARDNDGELYLLAHGDSGGIFKIVAK